jgi:hypothetical protein
MGSNDLITIHFAHRRHQAVDSDGDALTRFVRGPFATGPNIGRMLDLTHILAKLGNGLFPIGRVCSFVEKMFPILRKGRIELPGPHLPHLLHRVLSFLAKLESSGLFVQRGKEAPDHPFDMRLWKRADTGLHDEVFVKNKDLGADAGFVGRGIIGPG